MINTRKVRPAKARAPSAPKTPAEASRAAGLKRAQILAGAWPLFTRSGLDGVSVDELAQAAGVSKATLYRHFDDKQSIFLALLRERMEAVRQRVSWPQLEDRDAEQTLLRLGLGFLEGVFAEEALHTYRLVVSESHRYPAVGRAFESGGPTMGREAVAAYLRQLQEQGRLAVADAELAAEQFFALCQADIARRVHTLGERPARAQLERRVRSAVAVFLRGHGYRPKAAGGIRKASAR